MIILKCSNSCLMEKHQCKEMLMVLTKHGIQKVKEYFWSTIILIIRCNNKFRQVLKTLKRVGPNMMKLYKFGIIQYQVQNFQLKESQLTQLIKKEPRFNIRKLTNYLIQEISNRKTHIAKIKMNNYHNCTTLFSKNIQYRRKKYINRIDSINLLCQLINNFNTLKILFITFK